MARRKMFFQLFIIVVLFTSVYSAFGKWEVVRQDDFARNDGVNGDLQDVCFVNEKIGWAVGENSLILKTTDGGKSWIKQEAKLQRQEAGRRGFGMGGSIIFWSVNFRNENEGFITGSGGVILHTKDGGKTWERCKSASRGRLLGLCMRDKKGGFLVGENNTLLETTDGGITWNAINRGERVRVGETRNNLEDVFFATPKFGWIIGSFGTLMSTKDGGKTWTKQEPGGISNNLFSIYFVDEKEGWIAGQEGMILHTTDAGGKWEVQKTDTDNNLSGISFVNKKIGWAVGDYGTVMQTTDGGKTWKKLEVGNSALKSCSSVKPNHCWAVGEWGIILKYVE